MLLIRRSFLSTATAAISLTFGIHAGLAEDTTEVQTLRAKAVQKGIDYLTNVGQADDGSFSGQAGSAVTALCVTAILENRPSATKLPTVQKGLAFLESRVQPDGGVYTEGSRHRNYETCIAVQAMRRANENGKYDDVLNRAEKFLRGLQWDEGEGLETSDLAYGGAGYGGSSRPDLSNTSFLIEALSELGADKDDPAIQKALRFVSRTQNFESPANDTKWAPLIDDGGFYYTPAAGGQSKANQTPNGGLRSYGSMTYAGLKSMIFAGLEKDDPRVEAALRFIRDTYDLDNNPNMGKAGLYYYYQTFAKSLAAAGIETIVDSEGNEHDWSTELTRKLAEEQEPSGAWINSENRRWMEGDANLVTAYALLALANCK